MSYEDGMLPEVGDRVVVNEHKYGTVTTIKEWQDRAAKRAPNPLDDGEEGT